MLSDDDVQRLINHIKVTIGVESLDSNPLTYWASLPLCVIDSVWSIRADYERQVCPLIIRFCHSNLPPWDAGGHADPLENGGPTLAELVEILNRRLQDGATYETLFNNRQRTSSRSGILKAEAVHLFAKALLGAGINQPSDLRDVAKLEVAESLVKKVPGQASGLTFTYFLMLAGEITFVKSDTHIRRFVSDALSIGWGNLVTPELASALVTEAAFRFQSEASGLTAASLDYSIWAFQKFQTKPFSAIGE